MSPCFEGNRASKINWLFLRKYYCHCIKKEELKCGYCVIYE
jgi:hypothetical protein